MQMETPSRVRVAADAFTRSDIGRKRRNERNKQVKINWPTLNDYRSHCQANAHDIFASFFFSTLALRYFLFAVLAARASAGDDEVTICFRVRWRGTEDERTGMPEWSGGPSLAEWLAGSPARCR